MTNLIIVGAGGLALEVAGYAEDISRSSGKGYTLVGFLDDTKVIGAVVEGSPILGTTGSALDLNALYIIGVGAPEARAALAQKIAKHGGGFANLVHPTAYVAQSAKLGSGNILAPFSFVGARASVGDHCLLNIHSSVGHEAHIQNYCVLSPYANINGGADVLEQVFVGAHACVMPKLHIGKDSKIAAGAVVYSDVPAAVTVIGNPASHRQLR